MKELAAAVYGIVFFLGLLMVHYRIKQTDENTDAKIYNLAEGLYIAVAVLFAIVLFKMVLKW